MTNLRNSKDPFKCFLLIVARYLHRATMFQSLRPAQKTFNFEQNLNMKDQQTLVYFSIKLGVLYIRDD